MPNLITFSFPWFVQYNLNSVNSDLSNQTSYGHILCWAQAQVFSLNMVIAKTGVRIQADIDLAWCDRIFFSAGISHRQKTGLTLQT